MNSKLGLYRSPSKAYVNASVGLKEREESAFSGVELDAFLSTILCNECLSNSMTHSILLVM
jgi:hypothetical protein